MEIIKNMKSSNHPIVSEEEIDELVNKGPEHEAYRALAKIAYAKNKLGDLLDEYVKRTMLAERRGEDIFLAASHLLRVMYESENRDVTSSNIMHDRCGPDLINQAVSNLREQCRKFESTDDEVSRSLARKYSARDQLLKIEKSFHE